RHAAGVHRDRGGVDGNGAGAPAVGDLWRAADPGCGDADARAHGAARRLHAAVLLSRRDRGVAPLSPHRAQPWSARGVVARRLAAAGGRGKREEGRVTLADLLAGITVVALNAYVLLAGADFGGGVWDLLASGPRKTQQRERVAHAIGPVWEANHVWPI